LPFQALFWASGKGIGTFPYLLIVADNESELNVVANFVSDSERDAVINGAVEVFVRGQARDRSASVPTQVQQTTEVACRRTADNESELNVVANFVSDSESDAVINGAVEVFVGDQARVRIASLHTHGEQTTEVAYRRTVVGRDADLEWIVGDLNFGRTISDNTT